MQLIVKYFSRLKNFNR